MSFNKAPRPERRTIGDRIKAKRLEQSMTQRTLAKKAGVAHTILSLYENNRRIPRVDKLVAIARALNCPLTDIVP